VFKNVSKEEKNVCISYIGLAYDNRELIKLLTDRGSLISNFEFDLLGDMSSKISEKIDLKEDKYKRVVAAFVTFTTQEAR
jgi:hypothetical protein